MERVFATRLFYLLLLSFLDKPNSPKLVTVADMVDAMTLSPRAQSGGHQNAGPNSVSGMLSTLVPSFLVACLLIALFLVLRTRIQRIYLPRTYLGVLSEQ